jgi:ubiquinone/menaquinone biosynthesis C-methylase UbiE
MRTHKSDGSPSVSNTPGKEAADFDSYTQDYREQIERSISFVKQDHEYFVRNKVRHLLGVTTRHVGYPKDLSILDVGCGIGLADRHLVGEFDTVWGADISKDSIKVAKANTPGANFKSYDGARLPFDDDKFNVSFAMGVVHHVPPEERAQFIEEMARVTSANGLVVVFEHNPYNPLTRLAVGRCEFDEGVVLLSKKTTRQLFTGARLAPLEEAYILVLPWALRISDGLEAALKRVPLGAQYFVAGAKSRG